MNNNERKIKKGKKEDSTASPTQLKTPLLSEQREEEENNPLLIAPISNPIDIFYESTFGSIPSLKKREGYWILATGVAATLSSIIYFFSAQQTGKRYAELIPHSDWFFIETAPICCALTNALFNWEALLDLGGGQESLRQYLITAYDTFKRHFIREIMTTLVAIASVVPYWFITVNSSASQTHNVLATISAVINFFVLYDGVNALYRALNSPAIQQVLLQCSLIIAVLTGSEAKAEKVRNEIEWVKVKKILVNALQEQYEAFYWAEYEGRMGYSTGFREGLTENNTLYLLLHFHTNEPHLDPTEIIYNSPFLFFLKFIVLGSLGLLRNFGRLAVAWTAGASIHPVVGALCILFNLIPNLGFSIKGILGFGLIEFLIEIKSCRVSYTRRLFPYLFGAMVIFVRLNYIFSGFAGDALNYDGARDCKANETTAFTIGILSNFASAFVINGPQCECLLNRLTEEIILWKGNSENKQQMQFQEKFRGFSERLHYASLEEIKSLVRSPETRETIITFFQSKNFNSPVLLEDVDSENSSVHSIPESP